MHTRRCKTAEALTMQVLFSYKYTGGAETQFSLKVASKSRRWCFSLNGAVFSVVDVDQSPPALKSHTPPAGKHVSNRRFRLLLWFEEAAAPGSSLWNASNHFRFCLSVPASGCVQLCYRCLVGLNALKQLRKKVSISLRLTCNSCTS